jgi:hypothetical protein
MALGKRREEQQEMWVATASLPKSVGHIFCRKLNRLLAEADSDRWAEQMCEPYYHTHLGRPSIPPGVCFRMLLIGCDESIGSQRGIAWRCGDSHAGSRCGDEVDRAARQRRGLERVTSPAESGQKTLAAFFHGCQWIVGRRRIRNASPGDIAGGDGVAIQWSIYALDKTSQSRERPPWPHEADAMSALPVSHQIVSVHGAGNQGDGGGFRRNVSLCGGSSRRKPPPSPSWPVNGYHQITQVFWGLSWFRLGETKGLAPCAFFITSCGPRW